MRTLVILLPALLTVFSSAAAAEIIKINYEGFTVWVDCDRRGPALFHYVANPDTGGFDRHSSYEIDLSVPGRCQSSSNKTFQSALSVSGLSYDVGHQVPANHFDGTEIAIRQTNRWTNLLPQTASMNRGAWLATEEMIDCLRDEVPLEVWGGPIWGSNFDDDYFIATHGVQTPSAFWKVVIRTDNRAANGWIIPNGHAPRSSLDNWLEPINIIEKVTGRTFDAIDKETRPNHSWPRPTHCDLS